MAEAAAARRYVKGGEFEFDVVAARQRGDARVLGSVVRHEVFGRDAAGGYEEREDGEVAAAGHIVTIGTRGSNGGSLLCG